MSVRILTVVSLAEEDHLRTYNELVAELSTLGVLLSALSILFSIILSALRPVHHNNTFL